MNIIKGVTRIALVLAIMATVPGFLGGWDIYKFKKTITIELDSPVNESLSPEELQKRLNKKSAKDFLDEKPLDLFKEERCSYPPNWQCAIAGVMGSIVAFLVVFFSISGITRVFLWIIEGFKEQ